MDNLETDPTRNSEPFDSSHIWKSTSFYIKRKNVCFGFPHFQAVLILLILLAAAAATGDNNKQRFSKSKFCEKLNYHILSEFLRP
jgi:hypothetical protein